MKTEPVVTDIRADVSGFTGPLDKAKAAMERFGRASEIMEGRLGRMLRALPRGTQVPLSPIPGVKAKTAGSYLNWADEFMLGRMSAAGRDRIVNDRLAEQVRVREESQAERQEQQRMRMEAKRRQSEERAMRRAERDFAREDSARKKRERENAAILKRREQEARRLDQEMEAIARSTDLYRKIKSGDLGKTLRSLPRGTAVKLPPIPGQKGTPTTAGGWLDWADTYGAMEEAKASFPGGVVPPDFHVELERQRLQRQNEARKAEQEAKRTKQRQDAQRREARQAANRAERDRQRAATEGRLFRRQMGQSAIGGMASGFLSGNPVSGALGGLMSGMFIGGAPGAAVGAGVGAITGAMSMGVNALVAGLSTAVSLSKDLVAEAVRLGMQYEQNVAYFSAFTGGMEGGRRLIGAIQDVAISSPFRLSQLTGPASLLLGYGTKPSEIESVVGRLSMMAGGDSTRLHRLSLAYAQVMSHGRFMGQELRQFSEAGIGAPDFAQTMGLSTRDFRDKMYQGQVGPEVVIKTINRLTSKDGRFTETTKELLDTVAGRSNQLLETIEKRVGMMVSNLFTKFNVSDIIGGVTVKLGDFLDRYGPKMEDFLDNTFQMGGLVFQPLMDSMGNLIDMGRDFWNGPIGKMFLPQTWKDAKEYILSTGLVLSRFVGTMADANELLSPITLRMAGAYAMGNIATIPMGLQMFGKADELSARQQGRGFNYWSDKMAAPWERQIADFVLGKDPWAELKKAGAGMQLRENKDISIPITVPEETKAFARELRDSLRAGLNPLENFQAEMKKIRQASLPWEDARNIVGPDVWDAAGRAWQLQWLENNRDLTPTMAGQARLLAYQRLRAAVTLDSDSFKLPTSVMADTTEAVKTVIDSSFLPEQMDVQEEIKKVLEKANEDRQKQLDELKKLVDFFEKNPVIIQHKKL